MKTIIIELPETKEELKQFEKELYQLETRALKEANQMRRIVNREFSVGYPNSLFIPFCCETCKFEGGAFWHCHNPKSYKCHINVDKNNLCKHYTPNWGLMTFIWYRAFKECFEERREEDKKFINKIKEEHKSTKG